MKIVTIVGARPQFIKASAVSRAFRSANDLEEILVHTGQHYDENMSDVFFSELELQPPDYHLGIGGGTHGAQTGRTLEAVEQVLFKEKPDWVLVYGDTNSTLAGALGAAKLHVPIAHVEAGLRSFNLLMPEEVNRVLTDHMASLLFTPTCRAVKNLLREGFPGHKILQVGDVMFDAALFYGRKAELKSSILSQLYLEPKKYVLATLHRPENTDNPFRLKNCFSSLEKLAERFPVILPLHPRTRNALGKADLLKNLSSDLRLIEPIGYLDMILLEKNARLIVTDSGGVQKEAYFYGVPCATLRDETEWVELIELGWNLLAAPWSVNSLLSAFDKALEANPKKENSPYGNGRSAEAIAKALLGWKGTI